jgi:hypothetical protein
MLSQSVRGSESCQAPFGTDRSNIFLAYCCEYWRGRSALGCASGRLLRGHLSNPERGRDGRVLIVAIPPKAYLWAAAITVP